ncbi:3-dehydroquinate synthase [Kineosporia rhizophila]|uniref:3-dehydroquinate synthase n=1 Tax=Kineosporia TaxID=49184 RepID=UPI001E4FEC63|nr:MULTISPECIES: 3-dehydroquinate synthase [Kineosporia]MCE0539966.1 3-dehydroquinate synthase [Kineosporia rhizophila]GLY17319.1 3-dehydroquinate synthase [Kineosporia sp. NBRC 101677]
MSTTITVGTDDRYEVTIGSGVLAQLPAALGEKVSRVAVVHPRTLRALGRTVNQQLADLGLRPLLIEVPDGEGAKTAETLTMCWALLGQAGFTRSDAVVGLGGGAVTDLAGFVAASWLRGVGVVQVPTTLLGMVDAAVGGKTGINTAEGKNLVGAFHPPRAVICDLDALRTLPHADLVAGLAEVVKCGFIADPAILDLVAADPAAATTWNSDALRELVERAIAVKARVVTNDLKESGEREFLNYGHTFAHGVEQVEQYTWRHGEAVAVGMMYVARLGELAGRTPPELVARHTEALTSLGLPRTYRGDRWPALISAMGRDKKNRGDLMRFIVLDDLAKPGRLEGPDQTMLEEAYRLISE